MSKIIAQRTCIGCGVKKTRTQLIRIIVDPKDKVIIDNKKPSGRGAYLCRSQDYSPVSGDKFRINVDCLKKAVQKKAFNYAFKRKIDTSQIFTSAPASGSGHFRAC